MRLLASWPKKHRDVDFWVLVSNKINDLVEKRFWLKMAWMKAHTTTKEQAEITEQKKQTAAATDKADELAKNGVEAHGAIFTEQVAQAAQRAHQHVYSTMRDVVFFMLQSVTFWT